MGNVKHVREATTSSFSKEVTLSNHILPMCEPVSTVTKINDFFIFLVFQISLECFSIDTSKPSIRKAWKADSYH
jgi:hypothetical protein